MEKNVKRKIRFLLPVIFACLMAFSGILVPTFNGSTTGLENKNVLFKAESGTYSIESTTLTKVANKSVATKVGIGFGDTLKDASGANLKKNDTDATAYEALEAACQATTSTGNGIVYRFNSAAANANACSQTIVFSNAVDLKIVSSITLRLYLRLSTGTTYSGTYGDSCIRLYGYGDDGTNQSGYVIPSNTTQNKWIDLTISGTDLAKLATETEDGSVLKGLQLGGVVYSNTNNKFYITTTGQLKAFIVLDYITYEMTEPAKHYVDVTKNGTTLLASSDVSSQLVASNITKINEDLGSDSLSGYAINDISSTGAVNSTVWKMNFHSSGRTKGAAIDFSKPVALNDIESITIRMNAHFSSSSSYIVNLGGVMITALETTSLDKDTNAHVINANVQQDAWIDYTISDFTLNRLADGEGNINGIQIGSHIASDKNSDFYIGGGGQDKSWLLIDYVYYTPKYKASFEYEGAAITELESYTTAEKVELPNFTQNVDEVFVGWKQVVGNETYLYRAGEEITLTANTTFAAVTVDFDMIKGASIRVGDDAADSGIRFACTIDTDDYEALGNFAQGFGTMILPTESLTQKDFVMENFDPAKDEILIIAGERFDTETLEGFTLYTGVMVNVKEANYAIEFSARGYIKIAYTNGDGYIYTDYNATNNSRSISSVAKKILESGNKEYQDVQIVIDYAAKANQ